MTAAVVAQSALSLQLNGTGVFHMTGYEDTIGAFTLTANGMDGTFSFSASASATGQAVSVAEPSSLALLVISAVFGLAVRRRQQNA